MKEKEMDKLEDYLKANGFNYMRKPLFDGEQIIVYDNKGVIMWDAVCHSGSYGHERGLLEVMGKEVVRVDYDDVEGDLTAQDIVERLEEAKC